MGLSDLWKKHQGDDGGAADEPFEMQAESLDDGKDMVGNVIGGKYVIESVLGAGGMGVLYLAKHKMLGRKYVIKIIRLHLMDQQASMAVRRFKREAKSLANVPHPNVVEVVDYDVIDDKTPYFVMEYVEGKTLSEFMEDYPMGLPLDLFTTLMTQLCAAMARVHETGIVHRDLKPNNIMVQQAKEGHSIKILDFGLVNTDGAEFESAKLKLTGKGQILGTPAFMSPEQCRGEVVNQISDIYAMGLLGYEMITGMPAVDGSGFLEIIEKQINEKPDPIPKIRSDVPAHIVAAIDRAIRKDPKDRWQSCEAFLEALTGAAQEEEPQRSESSVGESTGEWLINPLRRLVKRFKKDA